MPKYRKKPVVVEATQWHRNGDHPDDNCPWVKDNQGREFQGEGQLVRYYRRPESDGQTPCRHCGVIMHDHGWIDTLEAGHNVCPGDWIITGIAGEYYPCKPDVFAATYDPVAE